MSGRVDAMLAQLIPSFVFLAGEILAASCDLFETRDCPKGVCAVEVRSEQGCRSISGCDSGLAIQGSSILRSRSEFHSYSLHQHAGPHQRRVVGLVAFVPTIILMEYAP